MYLLHATSVVSSASCHNPKLNQEPVQKPCSGPWYVHTVYNMLSMMLMSMCYHAIAFIPASFTCQHKEASSKAPCRVDVVPSCQGLHTNLPPGLSIEKEGPVSFLPDSHPPMCQIDVVSSSTYAQLQSLHMYIQAHLACPLSTESHICP